LAPSPRSRTLLARLAAAALAAPAASATPIAVAFEGTFTQLAGAPVSIPFDGTLFYVSDTLNPSASPFFAFYQFEPGSAGIRIHTADATYASDPGSADLSMSATLEYLHPSGQPTSPSDPDAVVRAVSYWTSTGGGDPSASPLIRLEYLSYLFPEEAPLPDSPGALVEALLSAHVMVNTGPSGWLSGVIASATPIPEPSSAALVGFGVALVATWRSAFRSRRSSSTETSVSSGRGSRARASARRRRPARASW
jgi:hypothetical protein